MQKLTPIIGLTVLVTAASARAQAVVPGEFTDPTNLRRQAAEQGGYQTPEALKFPYVSTYYVKPTVLTTEEASLGYFVTDWDSSKIRFLDDSFRFDVFLEYYAASNTPKRLVQKGVKSGDGAFNLGRLPKGKYTVGVWAKDAQGRESHRVWHEFRVIAPEDAAISADKVYNVKTADLIEYGIDNHGGFGREVLVEIGELPEKPKDKKQPLIIYDGYQGYQPLLKEIIQFFKTGVAPVSPEETLEIMAFMEAAEMSAKRGGAPVTLEEAKAACAK